MRLFHNRRGIELSINFIVMLILGIASFAGGMMFLGKFFGHAQEMRSSLDSQTERQIEKLLDSGSPVVLPISSKEILRNEFGTFGLGVMAKFRGTYTITVTQGDAFAKDKQRITWNIDDWNIQPAKSQSKVLEKNEKGKFLIGMTVPRSASKGTYIFIVTTKYDDPTTPANSIAEYDNPLQMIVQVP